MLMTNLHVIINDRLLMLFNITKVLGRELSHTCHIRRICYEIYSFIWMNYDYSADFIT